MKIYPEKEFILGKKDISLQVKLKMEIFLKLGLITGLQKKTFKSTSELIKMD